MRILADYKGLRLSKKGNLYMSFVIDHPSAVEAANALPLGICEVEVNRVRKDRTLSQNALLWKLIGDISMKETGRRTADSDMQIYRTILQKAGAKTEVLSMKEEALPEFFRRTGDIFRAYDIGHRWRNKAGDMWVVIHAYYGSSSMTTEEMHRVIDEALAYASEVGLDVEYWKEQFYE